MKTTYGEKYETPRERAEAFTEWYAENQATKNAVTVIEQAFAWLDLEAEDEEPLPCPFCGAECDVDSDYDCGNEGERWVRCTNDACHYVSATRKTSEAAVTAHNRVARAVAKSKGAKNGK